MFFGHGERQRQRRWYVAEQGFEVVGEHHTFDVFTGFFTGREQQAALHVGEILEAGDLLDLFLEADQAQPPLHHVEHLAAGVGEVGEVLGGDPEPVTEFAPHLGDLDDVTGQQRIGDAAYRDILDLVSRGALQKDPAGGRSTSYSLVAD